MDANQKARLIICIIVAIIAAFFLFLLAIINVLLLLVGIAALLASLLVLKQKKPNWFEFTIKKNKTNNAPPIVPEEELLPSISKVYMVLAGREDFGARSITVNKTSYGIGRGKRNDFVIEGKRISRYHLRIEYNLEENTSYAIDMDSKNGTYLNNVRMEPGRRYKLSGGDQLMIDDRPFDVSYAHY